MITAIRSRRRRADLLSRWSSTGCDDTRSNAPSPRQSAPTMATLDGYPNHQHLLLPPTRRAIARPQAHCNRRTHLPRHPNPHSRARCALRALHPRVRSLAAFGRRPRASRTVSMGRHPKPSTLPDSCSAQGETVLRDLVHHEFVRDTAQRCALPHRLEAAGLEDR